MREEHRTIKDREQQNDNREDEEESREDFKDIEQ